MFIPFIKRFAAESVKFAQQNALVSPAEKLQFNYKQVDLYSNKIAHYLLSLNIKKGDIVGLSSNRTINSYLIILGLLKLGVVIVPLDLDYPAALLEFIINDSSLSCIISNTVFPTQIISKARLINLEDLLQNLHDPLLIADNINTTIAAEDLIYIIYTSGSTGKPKGVCMSQGAVSEFLTWEMNYYDYLPNEKMLQFSPLNFDIFFQECLTSWSTGKQLIILPTQYRSQPDKLLHFINTEQINKIILPYVMFVQLAHTAVVNNLFPDSLKKIVSTGEALITTPSINTFMKSLSECKCYNLYGASENQIVSIYLLKADDTSKAVPIGMPLSGSKIFILDENEKTVKEGEIGHLHVTSQLLCSGYLNRKKLNTEKFISNPFQTDEEKKLARNSTLYKTGDIVRYLPDGNLEYVGRDDFQVKIRGYRIELGEIEATLLNYQGIKQSVVLVKQYLSTAEDYPENKFLVGYYVADSKLDEKDILSYLAMQLPSPMVPSLLIYLPTFPLTVNGKINKKALPEPEFISQNNYVAPSNDLEEKICQIWAKAFALSESKIGIDDDFFSLGGNSILAISLVNEINALLNIQIFVAVFLQCRTVKNIVRHIHSHGSETIKISHYPVNHLEEQRLSFAQERMWFIKRYEEFSTTYNELMVFQLAEEAQINVLATSIQDILSRHEILRTVIKDSAQGTSYQQVLCLNTNPFQYRQIEIESIAALEQHIAHEINYVFDLANEYPIKVSFYQLKNKAVATNYLTIMIHHIAFDGWSTSIFLKNLHSFYKINLAENFTSLKQNDLSPLPIQYKDFALWQRNYLRGELLERQLNFWRNKLFQFEPLNLMTDYRRPTAIDYQGKNIYFELTHQISLALRGLAKKLKVSLYCLLLSAYYLQLRIYSNQNDIVLGILSANRHYPEIENLIGFFVNSLPLRVTINPNLSIKEFIETISAEVIAAQMHQDLPFEKIVAELDIQKDTSRHPIFQILFEFQGVDDELDETLLQRYCPVSELPTKAKFDINVTINDSQEKLTGCFNYATCLYSQQTIQGYIETYTHILNYFAQLNSDDESLLCNKIADITYLSPARYEQIVLKWNETSTDYPVDISLAELFERQVEKTPNNIAVIADEVRLSYAALNDKVNRLAHYIQQNYPIKNDTIIMLILDRDIQFLIFMLAVFKSGIAYVPIDPAMPVERIQSILTESEPLFIATEQKYRNLVTALHNPLGQVCYYEELPLDNYNNKNLNLVISPYSLAYVIYTSGSTGRPKGAMVENKGMINHLFIKVCDMNITEHSRVAQTATQIFDVSVWQFISALIVGGTTVVFKDTAAWDPDKLLEIMYKEQVTIFQTVPSHMYAILPRIENDGIEAKKLSSLHWLMINGEPLSSEICDRWFRVHPTIPIINAYGPTECSDDVTHYKVFAETNEPTPKIMPISGTLGNTQIYITDDYLNPIPIGAIGEIVIGGFGVGRGYLNRPDLTAEKFVVNPFAPVEIVSPGKLPRLYRTGDLARYLHDGRIEYISRKDFQVKIRGYRIELGEIEAVLMTFAGISQSVAIVYKHKESSDSAYLVGYYVAEQQLDHDSIYRHIRSLLPEYMIPTVLIYLKTLPLTMNGKLDRKALPEPKLTDTSHYVASRTPMEQEVCTIWAEVLGLAADQISIEDDFFRLGGDSIVSIQLVSRLRQRLQVIVSVKDIFTHRTISRLYDEVLSQSINKSKKILIKTEQGRLTGTFDLLPVQQWFFTLPLVNEHHWNQSFLVKTSLLDIKQLKTSLSELFNYHDVFRLRYKLFNNDCYQQVYVPDANPVDLQILDVSSLNAADLKEIFTAWQSKFSLQNGPLYNIGYLHGYPDGSARVYFALHHLIVDTVSWRILVQDLQQLYEGKPLGKKGSSYRQWVNTVKTYKTISTSETAYWQSILADYRVDNHLISSGTLQKSNFELDKIATQRLLTISGHAYHTQINDLLLAALAMSLSIITGNEVNHIILEGHGREEIDESIDISRTVGWFTTLYPVRLHTQNNLQDNIKNIKEMLRALPTRGLGYGALIGYGKKSLTLPNISFNYQGQFDQASHHSWAITSEESGSYVAEVNTEHLMLTVNGWVIGGELKFDMISRWNAQTTQQFSELFKHYLLQVIEHTVTLARSYLTMSDINYVVSQSELDRLQKQQEISQIYLANNLQQGFIYHALSQGNVDDAYLVQMFWQYSKEIDPYCLCQAWQYAQIKYPALRLRFAWDESLIQIIDKVAKLDWRYIDLSTETNQQHRQQKIDAISLSDRKERYDLSQNPLFRVYLIKVKDNLYHCLFSMHHAMLDGWSCPILLNYVHDTYKKLKAGHVIDALVDNSYVQAQNYLQTHYKSQQDYWQNYLSAIEERSDLQGLLQSSASQQGIKLSAYKHIKNPAAVSLIVNDQLYKQLKSLSQKEGITLNAIMQYTWHKLLHIHGHSQQTVVGTTVSGRNLPIDDIEYSVGLYINTLPLMVDHTDQTVLDAIKITQANIHELHTRSNINLASLQQDGARLFDSLFIYENYPTPVSEANDSLGLTLTDSVEKLDYPLAVLVSEENNILRFKLQYAGELFSQSTVNNLLLLVEHLVQQIVEDPTQKTGELRYLSSEQYQQIIYAWNQTDAPYPRSKTLEQLFQEQVDKSPEDIALVYNDLELTYQALNEQANQLAHQLQTMQRIEPNTLIALCLDRNHQMVIAILAVLKAGGAYVPIDPSYPDDRIRYILSDTKASLILTNEVHQPRLSALVEAQLFIVDSTLSQQALVSQSMLNPPNKTTGADLAYVIYTSGTTGKPKGVMVSHRGVVNLIADLTKQYHLVDESILLFANYVFDASVEQLALALLNGHKLVVASQDTLLNEEACYRYLNQHQVTHLHLPPALLSRYDFSQVTHLKRLISGGDRFTEEAYQKLKGLDPAITIINEYGPTETTITATFNKVTENDVSIGRPIANTRVYVLDACLNPLPVQAIGELYLGGEGLAQGYLHQPQLTQEKFIANPFQTDEEKKDKSAGKYGRHAYLYRTGDYVRWQEDGRLAYIGRKDFQVKIRGYRIELGEVEAALLSHPEIMQAVVIAHKPQQTVESSQYLVGYYVSAVVLDDERLRQHLHKIVPDYLIPAVFIKLEELPLTVNGKLDRHALPAPDNYQTMNHGVARTALEQQICTIWAEVLGLLPEQVGIHSDFFRLGGDSIVSIQLVSRLRQRLGWQISLNDIFNYRTIANLYDAQLSHPRLPSQVIDVESGQLTGAVDLLPIQAWFFEQSFIAPHYWNQAFLIRTPPLTINKLQDSIHQLVRHHAVFCMRYRLSASGDRPRQYYAAQTAIPEVLILDISDLEVNEAGEVSQLPALFSAWQSDFNLETGPLYRFAYVAGYADGSARIYVAAHHLIMDTVSWRIISEDLQALYEGRPLNSKSSSYRQWVNTVCDYGQTHAQEREYWQQLLADYQEDTALALLGTIDESRFESVKFSLTPQLTSTLLKDSGRAYNTQINDLLLAALGMALAEQTGHAVHHLILEGHGREELSQSIDVSRTVGWFTVLYPVRLAVATELSQTIITIKEMLRQIPQKGIGYGALLGYGPNTPTLPRISFNYLGQFAQDGVDQAWMITHEASGVTVAAENAEAMVISINGWVIDDCLTMDITSCLTAEETTQLAEAFKRCLITIIEHTSKQSRSYLTPSDVNYLVDEAYLAHLQAQQAIVGVYLANSLQQGFIYHALNQGDVDDAYLVQMAWDYHTTIDKQALQQAWVYAQAKFATLRLRFAWEDTLVQVIDEVGQLDWRYLDLSAEVCPTQRQHQIEAIKMADRQARYDLSQSSLFRVYLIKVQSNHYHCLFSMHHAILDGWSSALLFNKVHDWYQQLRLGHRISERPDASYQQAQAYLQSHQADTIDYWQSYVAAIEGRPDLSGLIVSSHSCLLHEYRHIKVPCAQSLIFTGDLYGRLKAFSQQQGITLNVILQYVWHKLLHVYGHSQQTVVGTIISGRQLPVDGIEESVGLYINTLPLKVAHNVSNQSIVEMMRALQTTLSEITSKGHVNLASLQLGQMRLFDSLFIYENYPANETEANQALGVVWQESVEKLDYPLAVLAKELVGELVFELHYAGELFSQSTMTNLLGFIKQLVLQILDHPLRQEKELRYLSSEQYQQIIYAWNQTDAPYPRSKTFGQLFQEQVDKSPEDIALVYNDLELTYQALNEQANQLAHQLQTMQRIEPNTLIALCLDRNHQMVIAILAVLKAGGAYVPIDPSYPDDRIRYILSDTKASLILTNEVHQPRLSALVEAQLFIVDSTLSQQALVSQSMLNPPNKTTGADLAYVIYTSGTTGKPKGVMVSHSAYISTLYGLKDQYFSDRNNLRTYSITNYVFDIWGLEYGLPLLSGGSITLGDINFNNLNCQNYDFVQITPSLLALKEDNFTNAANCLLFVGGEQLKLALLKQAFQRFPIIINLYGPTETTIWSTSKAYSIESKDDIFNISIGKGLPNEKLYILDDNLNPLPLNTLGQLYIGGDGIAKGYLNNTELTNKKFVANPFQTNEEKGLAKNSMLYKTGDLVRWLADGNIEYVARNDSQIKFRGHRIELAEIEANLMAHYAIRQSVVLVCDYNDADDKQILVAYYVSDFPVADKVLFTYLSSLLPASMIPNAFIHLHELPLTVNGKLDQQALPHPDSIKKEQYALPRNSEEFQVRSLWSKILALPEQNIGIYDDFFRLGGNSISAISLMNLLNNNYAAQLKVADIFAYRTIEQLCHRINHVNKNYHSLIKLNHTVNQPNLFLIHPGAAGCEVYASLALKLEKDFSCYGVDSYNLYHEKKIETLHELAQYYLLSINKIMKETGQTTYHLLGWSLGGLLALEIASILEQQGIINIKVYLIDTIIDDKDLLILKNKLNAEQAKLDYIQATSLKGYDRYYIEKVIANMDIDTKLAKQKISSKLTATSILLFKAMMQEKESSFVEMSKYAIKLPYNNIEKFIHKKSSLKLIEVFLACHSNILDQVELLTFEIRAFNKQSSVMINV